MCRVCCTSIMLSGRTGAIFDTEVDHYFTIDILLAQSYASTAYPCSDCIKLVCIYSNLLLQWVRYTYLQVLIYLAWRQLRIGGNFDRLTLYTTIQPFAIWYTIPSDFVSIFVVLVYH